MERKLATVLFADLVGSTELVSDQDPEITRRRVTAFFDAVAGCIETHGGTVEKFAGDAVMAAFGIPQAHEDDAERAIRAALGIIENVHELGVEARIGIETGEVVVDETDSTFATGAFWSSLKPDFLAMSSGTVSGTRLTVASEPAARTPAATSSARRSMWP